MRYFPLEEQKIIRGCAAHIRAGLGCALDYVASYVTLYAPVSGQLSSFNEVGGGLWLRLDGDDGYRYEFAHLSERRANRRVWAGDIIGKTGNTGIITAGPHLHVQIFLKGKRVNPENVFQGAAIPGTNPIPVPPIGGAVTRKQWVDMMIPIVIPFWKQYHPGLEPDIESLIKDIGALYDGGDAGEQFKKWQSGQ